MNDRANEILRLVNAIRKGLEPEAGTIDVKSGEDAIWNLIGGACIDINRIANATEKLLYETTHGPKPELFSKGK